MRLRGERIEREVEEEDPGPGAGGGSPGGSDPIPRRVAAWPAAPVRPLAVARPRPPLCGSVRAGGPGLVRSVVVWHTVLRTIRYASRGAVHTVLWAAHEAVAEALLYRTRWAVCWVRGAVVS